MPAENVRGQMHDLIMDNFRVNPESLGQAIAELTNSFLMLQTVDRSRVWTFKHPTIADAISAFLGETAGQVELYLRGTKPLIVLAEVMCSGSAIIQDAIIVPESLNELLMPILASLPDDPYINSRLFGFLNDRTSETFFRAFVQKFPNILGRTPAYRREAISDSKIGVLSQAHKFGLLPEGIRLEAAQWLRMELEDWDASFLDDNDILALIPTTDLLRTLHRLRNSFSEDLEKAIASVTKEIDYDQDAEDHFYELNQKLEKIELALFGTDDEANENIVMIRDAIAVGVEEIMEAQKQHAEEQEREEWLAREWEERQSRRATPVAPSAPTSPENSRPRSIFSDVED
jgi:hypothetical protein